MDHTIIGCAVLEYRDVVYMLTDPLPLDIGSARYIGRLTSKNGGVEIHPASDDRGLLLVLGASLEQFARHVASVERGGAPLGDGVEFLERLYRL
jgi:hypothetical protein